MPFRRVVRGQDALPECQEALPEGRDAFSEDRAGSRGPPIEPGGSPGGSGCPTGGSGGPPGKTGVIGCPARKVGRFSRRVGSGRQALPVVQESLPVGRVWSRCPSCWPRVVRRLSRWARCGPEALPEGCEWSEDPLGVPGGVRGPPGGTGEDGRPSQKDEIGHEALPKGRWGWEAIL